MVSESDRSIFGTVFQVSPQGCDLVSQLTWLPHSSEEYAEVVFDAEVRDSDIGICLERRRTDANRRSKHHAAWSAEWTRGACLKHIRRVRRYRSEFESALPKGVASRTR
jgi:hypothetical protein